MKRIFRAVTVNLVGFLLGAGLLFLGLWLVYPPAALIGTGLMLVVVSLFGEGKG